MEPKNDISDEVNRVVEFLSKIDPSEDEYTKGIQNLKVLCEARAKRPGFLIEPEVLITAAVNIIGIVLILRHEQFNVVTTKAMTFIRPK